MKVQSIANGATTAAPVSFTYSYVIARDSINLSFLIATLNDLDNMSCDIQNAYLNAHWHEKIWFYARPEYGQHQTKVMIIERALFSTKSSGAAWRIIFFLFVKESLGFVPTWVDNGV